MRTGMIKTPEEIEVLRRGGELLSRVLGKVARRVAPGVTTAGFYDLALAALSRRIIPRSALR